MQINVGAERILELPPALPEAEIRERASAKRVEAFGQVARLFQRPKPEDIDITTVQTRYEPFWFAAATAHYDYDRRATYYVEVTPEVQAVTVNGQVYQVQPGKGRRIEVTGVDHCVEEPHAEVVLDGMRGQPGELERYLQFPKKEVASVLDLEQTGAVALIPEVRSSFVVRKLVMGLMKTFQADRVNEERIDVHEILLYYRPVFAVEYTWAAKQKRQVLEFDGLTGEAKAEPGRLEKQMARVLENDLLFDIGADTVGTFLPGANIAVKLGRFAVRKAMR
ncbi:MAG: hypothetical protein ACYC3S_03770 [Chloroflexota bacterium]